MTFRNEWNDSISTAINVVQEVKEIVKVMDNHLANNNWINMDAWYTKNIQT